MFPRLNSYLLLALCLLLPSPLVGQVPEVGRIIGQIRVVRGDFPPHQIMLELRVRGSAMDTAYADGEGRFGFYNLPANRYHVVINDDAFYPVDERVDVVPDISTSTMVPIFLRPREEIKKVDPMGTRASGSNPYLVDLGDYNKRFPKKAVKAYQHGLDAEHKGKSDDAISHYLEALKIAPDYYPAHNNLGSLYLGKSDFKSAEEQFREAIRLDQNDSQAYFNLGNLYLLTKRYPEAESALASGLQRRPDSAFGHFLEGSLLARTARYPEAETNLREALRLDPAMWQAHLQLVSVYLQQSRREDAINELQAFLKNSPTAPAAPNATQLLHRLQAESATAHP